MQLLFSILSGTHVILRHIHKLLTYQNALEIKIFKKKKLFLYFLINIFFFQGPEVYSESCQISKMERFGKIVNGLWFFMIALCCLLSQVALLLKIFLQHYDWEITSQVTFTLLNISFDAIKGYFDWLKPSHMTFSQRFFFAFYYKVFSQLKNTHCNINIEVSFLKKKKITYN